MVYQSTQTSTKELLMTKDEKIEEAIERFRKMHLSLTGDEPTPRQIIRAREEAESILREGGH